MRIAAALHDRSAAYYDFWNKVVALPKLLGSTVLSLLVATQETPTALTTTIGVCSAVITALDHFLNFGGKFNQHMNAKCAYEKLRLDLEHTISSGAFHEIESFKKRIQDIVSTSPFVPERVSDKYSRNVGDEVRKMSFHRNPDIPSSGAPVDRVLKVLS